MHLAAQPLVRESYRDPREHLRDQRHRHAQRARGGRRAPRRVRAHVIVTTDKVYRNVGQDRRLRRSRPARRRRPVQRVEGDGRPAAAVLDSQLPRRPDRDRPRRQRDRRRRRQHGPAAAGPDVAPSRAAQAPLLRYPDAVRPWQHVLDCLNGYLTLVDALLDGDGRASGTSGPGRTASSTVGEVADVGGRAVGRRRAVGIATAGDHPHEAALLALDASKAQRELGWRNRLGFRDAVGWTIDWERRVHAGADPLRVSREQITAFENLE